MSDLRKKYAFFLKEKTQKDNVNCSFYFTPLQKRPKSVGPVEISGVRYKANFETGEYRLYTRREYEQVANQSIQRSKAMLDMLLKVNSFDWFCTLTFDKEKINRADDEVVYKSYIKYINNIKHKYPSFKYITVLERHDDGNIHFHLLVGGLTWQQLGLVNTGKVCCHWATKKQGICSKEYFEKTKHRYDLKDTDGLIVYNITTFADGFTTATRIFSPERCSSYVKKYLDKAFGSTDIFKKRFYYSANLNVPKIVKRCIGADFSKPEDVKGYSSKVKNVLESLAEKSFFNEQYNVEMLMVSKENMNNISKGLIPINETTPFD